MAVCVWAGLGPTTVQVSQAGQLPEDVHPDLVVLTQGVGELPNCLLLWTPMLNLQKCLVGVVTVLVAGCGGGSSSSPTAPTSVSSVTFSGTVPNIVTGAPVGGATVTIGSTSATSGTDGAYTLAVTAAGQPGFSVSASGYYTRESAVSMTRATTINVEIIPQADGFDLAFFDHSFRDGSKGTTRWMIQPPVEIWTQIWRCVEPCNSTSTIYEATAETAPAYFERYAREAIAMMSDLTGGFMSSPVITTKDHPVGTRLRRGGNGGAGINFMLTNKFSNPSSGGGTWNEPSQSGVALTGSGLSFNQTHSSATTNNSIYMHEMAHALGFVPGHGADLSLVPGPSIMGPDPVVVTAKDRLHAKVLYKRPVGSLSPDRDPSGVTIN